MFLDEASGLLRHADETARTARQRASGHGREAAARTCRRCDPGRASTRDRGLRSAPSRDRDRPPAGARTACAGRPPQRPARHRPHRASRAGHGTECHAARGGANRCRRLGQPPPQRPRRDPDHRDGRHAARSPAAGDEPAALRLGDRRLPVGSALTAADRHVGALRRTSAAARRERQRNCVAACVCRSPIPDRRRELPTTRCSGAAPEPGLVARADSEQVAVAAFIRVAREQSRTSR